jgi:hypothetical protein
MRYQYRVYQNESGLPKPEMSSRPMSTEQVLHEYQQLQNYLCRRLPEGAIEASCSLAKSETDGVIVVLVTELPEHDVDSSLVSCLKERNEQVRGLCLAIDKQ